MSELHSSYPLTLDWTEGKQGVLHAPGGLPDLEVASPPEFDGPGGRWTPEHLFVAAAAACWMTTFRSMVTLSRVETAAITVAAEGFLEKGDDRLYSIPRLVLQPHVVLRREEDRERAARLIRKAEEVCLVARSMRATVELEFEISVAPAEAA
ncbi:MAG: OsmC family protein [Thermoanaerobaculia bacterium]